MRIGGPASAFTLPASRSDLLRILACCTENSCPFLVIGNGSNIVFDDAGFRGVVISTLRMRGITFQPDGIVRAEAGILNPQLIRVCHHHGLGGIEYLYSVPGTLGGAVVMNAGRGRPFGLQIGDCIETVDIWDGSSVRTIPADACGFGYRDSVFRRQRGWIVLEASLRLPASSAAEGKRRVEERMRYVEHSQDRLHPNAGTVFSGGFERAALSDPRKQIGDIALSPVTANWFCNTGGGTARDVRRMIAWIGREHRKKGHPQPALEIDLIGKRGRQT